MNASQEENENTEDKQEESEPYLVEKIVKKRFRSGVATDNTWELPSNVPADILSAFGRTLIEPSNPRPHCQGLRQFRNIVYQDDFILNM